MKGFKPALSIDLGHLLRVPYQEVIKLFTFFLEIFLAPSAQRYSVFCFVRLVCDFLKHQLDKIAASPRLGKVA